MTGPLPMTVQFRGGPEIRIHLEQDGSYRIRSWKRSSEPAEPNIVPSFGLRERHFGTLEELQAAVAAELATREGVA
jgi:hypothetical protein